MTDYTPTTGEMVAAYTFANPTGPRAEREAEALRWLAEHDREQRAIGWDEGYDSGECDGFLIGKNGGLLESERDVNPYRETEQ